MMVIAKRTTFDFRIALSLCINFKRIVISQLPVRPNKYKDDGLCCQQVKDPRRKV